MIETVEEIKERNKKHEDFEQKNNLTGKQYILHVATGDTKTAPNGTRVTEMETLFSGSEDFMLGLVEIILEKYPNIARRIMSEMTKAIFSALTQKGIATIVPVNKEDIAKVESALGRDLGMDIPPDKDKLN